MRRIHRYLLKQCLLEMLGLTVLITGILLLERLFRIADLVSQSPGKLSEASVMIVSLIPHYLGIALPAAFFLAVLLTINRISRSGELVSVWGAGQSLWWISRPFMLIGIVLVAVSLILTGLLQPLSRYEYRKTGHLIANTSVETVFQEGKFVLSNDWTVWTDGVDRGSGQLRETFLLERRDQGQERILVAQSGRLLQQGNAISHLELDSGMGANGRPSDDSLDKIEFQSLTWKMPDNKNRFRDRGEDERELTLTELSSVGDSTSALDVPVIKARASLHDQLTRALLFLFLPLLAVPLGLDYGRMPASNSVLVGLILLIAIQKSFDLGKSINEGGGLGGFAGSWAVLLIVIIAAIALYLRSALTMAQPPPTALPRLPRLRSLRRDQAGEPPLESTG